MRVPARVVLLLAGLISASSIFISALKAQSSGGAAPPVITAAREQQLFQQFCYGCHNQRVQAMGLDSAKKLTLDTLDTAKARVTLVDLKAGNLSVVLDTFDRIGALEAARSGQFDIGLFHVLGQLPDS